MPVKNLEIEKDGELVTVVEIHVDGSNYIKLRDVEKLAAVTVDYDAARRLPVITAASAAGDQDVLRGWRSWTRRSLSSQRPALPPPVRSLSSRRRDSGLRPR